MIYKIVTIALFLISLFSLNFCLTTEKGECLYEERRNLEKTVPLLFSCESMIFGFGQFASQYKEIQDLIILTCLLDYSVRFNCRNKSSIIPVIGDNDWGRSKDE
ncbi:MAG: hypothetical protein H7A23_11085 [Leptospiraceae bacterium]|nr:hypothetical protein [Leptospiraceae bacterium]